MGLYSGGKKEVYRPVGDQVDRQSQSARLRYHQTEKPLPTIGETEPDELKKYSQQYQDARFAQDHPVRDVVAKGLHSIAMAPTVMKDALMGDFGVLSPDEFTKRRDNLSAKQIVTDGAEVMALDMGGEMAVAAGAKVASKAKGLFNTKGFEIADEIKNVSLTGVSSPSKVNKGFLDDPTIFNSKDANKIASEYLGEAIDPRNVKKLNALDELSGQGKSTAEFTKSFKAAVDEGRFEKNIKFQDEIKTDKEFLKVKGVARRDSDQVIERAKFIEESITGKHVETPQRPSLNVASDMLNDYNGQIDLLNEGATQGAVRHETNHLKEKYYNWDNFETKHGDVFHEPTELMKSDKSIKTTDEATKFTKNYDYLTKGTEMSSYLGTNLKDVLVEQGKIKSVHDPINKDILNWAFENKIDPVVRYQSMVKDKDKFVNLINELPYSVAGIGVGLYNLKK